MQANQPTIQSCSDLHHGWFGVISQQGIHRHHHSRSTEAALGAMALGQSLLESKQALLLKRIGGDATFGMQQGGAKSRSWSLQMCYDGAPSAPHSKATGWQPSRLSFLTHLWLSCHAETLTLRLHRYYSGLMLGSQR